MKASVVICTYNRANLLADSIRAVQMQDFPEKDYEILVIDNNSRDNTKEIVASAAKCSKVRIRYIFEDRQGLSYARNTGIEQSSGEIVAFVDDDIDAADDWLKSIISAFESIDVVAAGGPIRPVWPFEKPAWLSEKWQGFFTINEYPQAKEKGEFHPPHYPWGANMAFRRDAIIRAGMFSTDLGRVGTSLLSCEEKSLFQKIYSTGGKVAFAPAAVIHHKIPADRLNKLWLYHRTYWQGRSNAVIDVKEGKDVYRNFLRELSALSTPNRGGANDFDQKCRKREALGYIFQVLNADIKGDFRRLRALSVLLNSVLGTEDRSSNPPSQPVTDNLNRYTQELLRSKDDEIQALLNSWSWKVTAPLRVAYEGLKRLRSMSTKR